METTGTAAFILGRKAANDSLAPSLNPFQSGTQEFTDWQLGHQSALDSMNDHADRKPAKEFWEGESRYDMGFLATGSHRR